MNSQKARTPRISQLADRLAEDIEDRKLKSGDRYMTTCEASKMLGVGNSMANRALQILERRQLIVRQQRRGAYVIDPPPSSGKPVLDRIHFLVHQKYLKAEGVGQDEVLLGIEHELPGVPVQISFLSNANEADFVNELLADSLRAKRTDGYVLVRATYEMQRVMTDLHVTSVVYGTPYPSIDRLSSLSPDMTQTGRLLANYLIKHGHTRLAYFNRQIAYGGDLLTIDGINEALLAAGFHQDALTLRFLPTYSEVYAAEAESLLSQEQRPTGFICRTIGMADSVRDVAVAKGLVVGQDIEIALCDYFRKPGEPCPYTRAKAEIGSEEQGRQLAKLLVAQIENRDAPAAHELIKVVLEQGDPRRDQ